jgi:hypothetical protein
VNLIPTPIIYKEKLLSLFGFRSYTNERFPPERNCQNKHQEERETRDGPTTE